MNLAQRSTELLVELGLIADGELAEVRTLAGGVSSDIASVTTASGVFCVKFALAQLKVAETWTAPVRRNVAEYEWLSYVAAIDPELVPRLIGRSARLGGFAMVFLDPRTHANWKSELLRGTVDLAFAASVGRALGQIHRHAARDRAGRARFANQDDFRALRLDPYLDFTAGRHGDLAARLHAMSRDLMAARVSLVHGDVSPKNILKGPHGPIFLDAECAVEGDPSFDVAFCLNHLAIKLIGRIASPTGLKQAITDFWSAYVSFIEWEPPEAVERRVTDILPALMLARIDGKSPVEYLGESDSESSAARRAKFVGRAPSVHQRCARAYRRGDQRTMTGTQIHRVSGRQVWDSRGRPTIEAEVQLENGRIGRAIAPAGASRGQREAVDLRDGATNSVVMALRPRSTEFGRSSVRP